MVATVESFINELKKYKERGFSMGSFFHLKNATNKENIELLSTLIKEERYRHDISFYNTPWKSIHIETIDPLFKAIFANPNITDLSLICSRLQEADQTIFLKLAEYICKSNLIKLDISDNKLSESPHAIQFLINLSSSQIQQLECSNIGLDACNFLTLTKVLKAFTAMPKLVYLNLDSFGVHAEVTNKQYLELLSIVFKSQISKLSFDNNSVFGRLLSLEEFGTFLKHVSEASQLKSLTLSLCGLNLLDLNAREAAEAEKEDAEAFVIQFGSFLQSTHLETINLFGNDFSRETTIALLGYALKNKTLNINIKGNGLSDKEIEEHIKTYRETAKKKMEIELITAGQNSQAKPVLMAFSSTAYTGPIPKTVTPLIVTNKPPVDKPKGIIGDTH